MSLTTTQSALRDAVRRTADVVAFTDKHPDARCNDLINQGLGALSRLCRTTNPEFQPIATTTITCDGTNTLYALPAAFRSLLSAEYVSNGSKLWMTPYELQEHALLSDDQTSALGLRGQYYRVLGTNIDILPKPPANDQVTLWYATTVTQLASDPATVDVMDRLDSYVIWWAAREIAMERSDWERHDRLTAKMQEMEGDIRILARSIDLSAPSKVKQMAYAQPWMRKGWWRR
jgi:hypothetical protein